MGWRPWLRVSAVKLQYKANPNASTVSCVKLGERHDIGYFPFWFFDIFPWPVENSDKEPSNNSAL